MKLAAAYELLRLALTGANPATWDLDLTPQDVCRVTFGRWITSRRIILYNTRHLLYFHTLDFYGCRRIKAQKTLDARFCVLSTVLPRARCLS